MHSPTAPTTTTTPSTSTTIEQIYERLLDHFGARHWWPADTPFEVIVGAILTQNTAWQNVEKAIENLKRDNLLDLSALARAELSMIENAIRPSGFFRQKAQRLKSISEYLYRNYNGDLKSFFDRDMIEVRNELLALNGVGPETADSILLYAGNKPIFVIDAYTRRVCTRIGLSEEKDYHELQIFFMSRLPTDVKLYNEYHALIVELAKNYCRTVPLCSECPVREICGYRCCVFD